MKLEKIKIPESINQLKSSFSQHGKELFLVGGCVRDAILGVTPKDFDLVTDATPDIIIEICHTTPTVRHIVETGKSFGVINVVTDSDEFEIATYRMDSSESDGRRPDSVTFCDMKGDAERRDLTINALYMGIDTKEVIDLIGGLDDIMTKTIRTVGLARDRFDEDKLRILRVLRFASRFDSKLSDDIHSTLARGVDMSMISMERIRDEFIKSIKSCVSTTAYLRLLEKYDLLKAIFPDVKVISEFDIETKDVESLVAILLSEELKTSDIYRIKKYLNTIKYPTEQIRQISFMLSTLLFTPKKIRAFKKEQSLSGVAKDRVEEFLRIICAPKTHIDMVSKALEHSLIAQPEELMSTHKISGKELGELIDSIEIQAFMSELSDKPQ